MKINEGVIFMSDGAKIIIAGIMGYTAYRIAKEFADTLIAIKAINCGMMLEANKNEKR
jgi:hypothetical protein